MALLTILRQPDRVLGATEATPFRFEEEAAPSPVDWRYTPTEGGWKITVYPGKEPVKFLKLRWHGDYSRVEAVLGDEWGRISATHAPVEWRSIMPFRPLPWFCLARQGEHLTCYGVKTGCDCFAFFQMDAHGVTLFLNLMSGSRGTSLKEPLEACVVTETETQGWETIYETTRRFMGMLCDRPVLPKGSIFGVNNWYWAYGDISRQSVLQETDYLMEMTDGVRQRPCMIIDDGWQLNRTSRPHPYIGGPFAYCNARFGNMEEVACRIREKGARPGIWFRPLLTLGDIPREAHLRAYANGMVMDPSHPYTLERVQEDTARLRTWGYEIIKHDFSTNDALAADPFAAAAHMTTLADDGKAFWDNTKTTATILKNLYKAIQAGAGDGDVIGCSVIGHLSAGIHSIQRVGNDTSGRSFEWTVRNGVHSFMRLPMNDRFFRMDPDCAAFTQSVDPQMNMQFLELCAMTGVTTLASVKPGLLTEGQLRQINRIYRMADQSLQPYGILDYARTAIPEEFSNGQDVRCFDWTRFYDGARTHISWME